MIVTVNRNVGPDRKFGVSDAGLQYEVEEGDAFIFVDAARNEHNEEPYNGVEIRMPLQEAIDEFNRLVYFLQMEQDRLTKT